MPLIRRVPWTVQPQTAAPYERAALSKLGICGGFIIGGAESTPRNFDGTVPGVFAGTQLYVDTAFNWKPATFGRSGSIFDSGGTRYMVYRMGAPSARNFTFSAKVKYNQARTLILRSGNTGSGTTILLWRNSGFDMRVNGTDYTAAGTWNLDQWYDIQIVGTDSSCVLYVDGAVVINGAAAAAGNLDSDFAIGDVTGGGSVDTDHFEIGHCIIANRAWSVGELAAFRANPWQLFEPRRVIIPVSVGAGGGGTITAVGIASAEAFGSLSLTAGVAATGIASAEALGQPVVSTAGAITAVGIASAETFGQPALGPTTSATGIASAEAFGQPALGPTVSAAGIPSVEVFGQPALRLEIRAAGIASAEAFGQLVLGTPGTINAAGIASAEAFGQPAVGFDRAWLAAYYRRRIYPPWARWMSIHASSVPAPGSGGIE